MSTSSKKPRGGNAHLGWAPLDDPRYTGGWNFIFGKNLNPNIAQEPHDQSEASPPQDKTRHSRRSPEGE